MIYNYNASCKNISKLIIIYIDKLDSQHYSTCEWKDTRVQSAKRDSFYGIKTTNYNIRSNFLKPYFFTEISTYFYANRFLITTNSIEVPEETQN